MNKLILLTGPSGVGKTTIARALLKAMPNLQRLVTYTTREPRPNEQNGVDYNFVSKDEFKEKLTNNEFFESAEVYGNFYGNSRKDLEKIWRAGKICLAVLDVQGVESVKKIFPEAKTIFILPDNLENLKKRIRERPMSDEAFANRWKKVEEEMGKAEAFDFQIVNKQNAAEETAAAVKKIIENAALTRDK